MGQDQMKLIFTALPRTLISKIGLKKKKQKQKKKPASVYQWRIQQVAAVWCYCPDLIKMAVVWPIIASQLSAQMSTLWKRQITC